MHSKTKGSIGQLTVATDLLSKGYEVFTELGDNSKIDLIAVSKNYDLIKIQVKCLTPTDGSVKLSSIKSGPNYKFKYERRHADVYAVYVPIHKMVLYVSADELLTRKKTLSIRVAEAKNKQKKNTYFWDQYIDFEKCISDK